MRRNILSGVYGIVFNWIAKQSLSPVVSNIVKITAQRVKMNLSLEEQTGYNQDTADEAMFESNERYRSLFDNSLAAMVLIDPDDCTIISANQSACSFYGYSKNVLTGLKISEIIIQDTEQIKSAILDAKSMRQSYFKFRQRLASGSIRDVEVYVTPLDLNGRIILHSIIHDITERTRIELALYESEKELRRRNDRFEKDMELAQIVHKQFIPRSVDSSEKIHIDFRYYPHDAIGGDYFSFTPVPNNGLGVFIGDVVGHGIAASLFLSLLKSATDRVSRHHCLDPKLYLQMLNAELIDYLNYNFITAIYGLISYDDINGSPSFTFSNGGHPKPVLHRRSGNHAELLHSSGTVLGVFPDMNCTATRVSLERGDRIFLYTDGIPEARDQMGNFLGYDTMPELVKRSDEDNLGKTLDSIINDVHNFNGGEKIEDDIVLIGIELR